MTITTSPDITSLLVQVTWDISGNLPVIRLLNLSEGSGLGNVSWTFVAKSPSGTFIYNGNINDPLIEGEWTAYVMANPFPRPFNSIEWSGAPYQFSVIAKDSDGNVFTTEPQLAYICRPVGNTQFSKNTFGAASSDVNVKCQQARIFFQDTTYHSYKGQDGSIVSSNLKVVYPIDETGNIPDAFAIINYSSALVPISYSSSNYQFLQNSVYDYDMGDYVIIRVKYQCLRTFGVWCNIDLQPLQCEINKLADEIATGNCSDVQAAQNKLNLITPKLMLIVMGIQQPLLGVDIPALIEQIIAIGGFSCDCCGASTGIIPVTASIIDSYSFSVNKLGGDVNGNFTNDGSNIVLNIGDVSYIVKVNQTSPSTVNAFVFGSSVSGDGFTKTYELYIDGHQLALDVLNNIAANADALNLLNSLITAGSANFKLTVDGGCIFNTTASCDYDFALANIPASVTYALITNIKVGNINHPLSYSFNLTNLTGLQGYMNSLGYGTFVVTNLGSGNVLISSDNNTNELVTLNYKVGGTSYIADFSRNCTGYQPISANEVVQNIIDYICGLTDLEIATSEDYTISYIDTDGAVQAQTVTGGSTLNAFILALLARGVQTINYISGLNTPTCNSMKSLFPNSIQVMQANDYLLGTKNNTCARIFPVEFLTQALTYLVYDTAGMAAFCAAVALCNGGNICTPYSQFQVETIESSPEDDTFNLLVTFDNPGAMSNDISYARIDNTASPIYFTHTGILPGQSPFLIPISVFKGQYSVGIKPNYADGRECPTIYTTTPPCTGIQAFSGIIRIDGADTYFDVTYTATSPMVGVTINYPNGGVATYSFTSGDPISILLPPGVFGTFSATMNPICNEETGWVGARTAPVIFQRNGSVTVITTVSVAASISAISGIAGFTLPAPLTGGAGYIGTHVEFISTICATVSGPAGLAGFNIYINGVFAERVAIPDTGTHCSLTTYTINATDTILLDFNQE